jgi:SNF2 family DNA or RNA helicase
MLVSLKHQQLILNARNPNQLLTVIPTAKPFDYKGHTLVAVPHQMDEVMVLNNLGVRAPSPIETRYDWIGVERPFDVQRITAGAATIHKRLYILNQMGTGKTNAAVWAADYLMGIGKVRRVLIVCPLSCIERVWADSLFNAVPERTFEVVYGPVERRVKRLQKDADFYIVNHHGLAIPGVLNAIMERDDIDLVIVDELAEYSNVRTDNWLALDTVVNGHVTRGKKRVKNVHPRREYVWGLTGTPTPTAPTDAWAQCRLLTPDTVSSSFVYFRQLVMSPYGPYKWKAKSTARDTVFAAMQPAVRFARDDCLDLPPRMITQRHCELSAEQQKAYNEMHRRLKTELADGQLVAKNAAVKILKLAQIAVGVAYDVHHGEIVIPSAQRLEALREIINESEGKVIVYVPFTGALNHLLDYVRKHTQAEMIDGSVPKGQRDIVFDRFQRDPELRVLVAHPAAMAHGLTLTESNTIVWYGPTNSNRIFTQANDRITRAGQVRKQFIIQLEGTPLERAMYRALQNQTDEQQSLLDLFAND